MDRQVKKIQPIDHLIMKSRTHGGLDFFNSGHQAMSYSTAYRQVNQIAIMLRKIGVKPGDIVALDLPANLHLLFTQALFHEAAIGCLFPPGLDKSGALIFDWVFSATFDSHPLAHRAIRVNRGLLKEIEGNSTEFIMPRRYESENSVCRIIFSSGTTGQPKPVAFTIKMVEHRVAAATRFWMHTTPFMCLLDIGTVSGFQTFYSSVMNGQTYLVPGMPPHNISLINRHKVASIKASPSQIAEITAEIQHTGEKTSTLRTITSVGSILPSTVAKAARAATGAEIHNLYGSTETGTVTMRNVDSDNPFNVGSLVPGAELQIVDSLDCELPFGEIGVIRYKRELQATGYFKEPNSIDGVFKDGWFYPGDTGFISNKDTLILTGRTSEIINVGGVKIDPAAVDQVAIEIPGVLDVASFGYENELGMIEFAIAVVDGENFDSDLLIERLKLEFGSARPRAIVVLEKIPRNLMGKPLRAELARRYTEKRERK